MIISFCKCKYQSLEVVKASLKIDPVTTVVIYSLKCKDIPLSHFMKYDKVKDANKLQLSTVLEYISDLCFQFSLAILLRIDKILPFVP